MAMPRKLPVEFATAFPYGAYAVGEVQPSATTTVRPRTQSSRPPTPTLGCSSGRSTSSTVTPRPGSPTAR